MGSLGSFGRKYDAINLDFEFFGETIRANPGVSRMALVEFMAEAGSVAADDEIAGSKLIMNLLREVVHPEDFDLFIKIAKRERQDPQEDLMPIAKAIMEAETGFPTGQPSVSVDGRQTTFPKFTVDSSLPDITQRALRHTEGRPDLQVAVLRAAEL